LVFKSKTDLAQFFQFGLVLARFFLVWLIFFVFSVWVRFDSVFSILGL